MTEKTKETSPHRFTSKQAKQLYSTLDVFAQGKTGKAHFDTNENIDRIFVETSTPQSTIISGGDGENNNYVFDEPERNTNSTASTISNSRNETVLLQTGAKMYHGRTASDKEEQDEVEESIKAFISVPEANVQPATNGNLKKEAFCYLWYPNDKRRWVCEEGFDYLSKRLKERGVTLKIDHVDLKHFNLEFPVLILCVHPPEERSDISLGDMQVVLVILHRQPHPPGDPEPPLANDLYWRRYRNLSLILDMKASSHNTFHDTWTNMDSSFRLSQFLKRWA